MDWRISLWKTWCLKPVHYFWCWKHINHWQLDWQGSLWFLGLIRNNLQIADDQHLPRQDKVNIGFESWAHSFTLNNLVQYALWILDRRGKQLAYHQLIIISIIILLVWLLDPRKLRNGSGFGANNVAIAVVHPTFVYIEYEPFIKSAVWTLWTFLVKKGFELGFELLLIPKSNPCMVSSSTL